jgi:hypothetical protein
MNTSSTGGYAQPSYTQGNPKGLNLTQFLQTVFAGLTNLPGTLVRPKWQPEEPEQPDIKTNWLAYGIASQQPTFTGYIAMQPDNTTQYQRQEQLEIQISVYGPDALEVLGLITDGFQIPQNQAGLLSANMGLVEVTKALHIPELINERFFNRYEMTVVLNRQVQRLYPILKFLSATGTIYTQTGSNPNFSLSWDAQNE